MYVNIFMYNSILYIVIININPSHYITYTHIPIITLNTVHTSLIEFIFYNATYIIPNFILFNSVSVIFLQIFKICFSRQSIVFRYFNACFFSIGI